MNLNHLARSEPLIAAALAKDPNTRFYTIRIDLQISGRRGAGIGGRVQHFVSPSAVSDVLMFAEAAEDAPIIHFGGDWQITLFGQTQLKIGRERDVLLALGTAGIGPGTTAFAAYRNLVPEGLFPKLEVTFPGDTGRTAEYVLLQRCCTVVFHDRVRVPDDVSP